MATGTDTTNTGLGQPIGSNGFNFDNVHAQFGKQADNLDKALKDHIKFMDPQSTKDMVDFQVLFNKYMIVEGLRSSIIKSIKDTIQSIIQKI